MGHKISKEQIDPGVKDHIMSFVGDISKLETDEKSDIISAVNSLMVNRVDNAENMGKIANAIGEPVTANHSVDEVVQGLGEMLSTFKTNMMNNGVTVESSDKFKSLIDKIATLADNEGKGIQYASGNGTISSLPYKSSGYQAYVINTNLDFTPTVLFWTVESLDYKGEYGTKTDWTLYETANSLINVSSSTCLSCSLSDAAYDCNFYLSNVNSESFTLNYNIELVSYSGAWTENVVYHWYAIGVGEEDTTLRDSLASILQDEGVGVTEEDDMASLIGKVNSEFNEKNTEISSLNTTITLLNNQVNSLTSELAGKITPAGTAVAGDVLSGKTFINSTGQLVTGTMSNRGGAQTITPGTSNKTLNAGYYSGNITIAGDADLKAANIVSGKNIFGVAGTATASSLGGKRSKSGTTSVDKITPLTISNLGFKPSIVLLYYTVDGNKWCEVACTQLYGSSQIQLEYDSYWNGTLSQNGKIILNSDGFTVDRTWACAVTYNWLAIE